MRYFRWLPFSGGEENELSEVWNLSISDKHFDEWTLMSGKVTNKWDINTTAYYEVEVKHTDFPFTTSLLPVYSSRLRSLIDGLGIKDIQYLPIRIKRWDGKQEISGYSIANYLSIIDCLNREKSVYEVWTKDNLLFWEKRPLMLGTFRDVKKAVLDLEKIGDTKIFRLWGWEMMVVVCEDVKNAIEAKGITGCEFFEIEVI